ncbi:MAG: 50S ribosomal protein L22 [Candidatus Marinimicrobia bacterium]|nr:50S ribosomal protein L22 [Candidatus Neomarinimicrobiota bacterium]|tara:strand:- start:743 stop:1084 length:342 start_codon:yes stop_codon:yes gene_type:complete
MEAIARKRFIRQSPYKIRYVLNMVKGLKVEAAVNKLSLTNKKASSYIIEVLNSAVSNMMNIESDVNSDTLYIKTAYVDEGPVMKRFRPAAMGRATGIRKRTSHLTIIISSEKG